MRHSGRPIRHRRPARTDWVRALIGAPAADQECRRVGGPHGTAPSSPGKNVANPMAMPTPQRSSAGSEGIRPSDPGRSGDWPGVRRSRAKRMDEPPRHPVDTSSSVSAACDLENLHVPIAIGAEAEERVLWREANVPLAEWSGS